MKSCIMSGHRIRPRSLCSSSQRAKSQTPRLLGPHLVGTTLARAERDRGVAPSRLPDGLCRQMQSVRPYGMRIYKEEAARWTAWSAQWTARELGNALRATLAADNALKTATVSDDRGIVTQLVLGFAPLKREAA